MYKLPTRLPLALSLLLVHATMQSIDPEITFSPLIQEATIALNNAIAQVGQAEELIVKNLEAFSKAPTRSDLYVPIIKESLNLLEKANDKVGEKEDALEDLQAKVSLLTAEKIAVVQAQETLVKAQEYVEKLENLMKFWNSQVTSKDHISDELLLTQALEDRDSAQAELAFAKSCLETSCLSGPSLEEDDEDSDE